MKKIIVLIVFVFFMVMVDNSVFAEGCKIPKFIHKGAKIEVSIGSKWETVTVIEIDEKSCWIKTDKNVRGLRGPCWLNLNAIVCITP
jgi:hypothetical protein